MFTELNWREREIKRPGNGRCGLSSRAKIQHRVEVIEGHSVEVTVQSIIQHSTCVAGYKATREKVNAHFAASSQSKPTTSTGPGDSGSPPQFWSKLTPRPHVLLVIWTPVLLRWIWYFSKNKNSMKLITRRQRFEGKHAVWTPISSTVHRTGIYKDWLQTQPVQKEVQKSQGTTGI